jgi:hypothetical protein
MIRLLAALGWLLAGCGYHVAGAGAGIPETARTISIRQFSNHTRERGLEVRLQQALEDEFRRRGRLRVVPDPEGDLILSGTIRSVRNIVVAFSATDEAVQYQGIIRLSMRLTDRATGRVVQENPLLQESQDFGAVSGVVVSSSPHFQRGTLNARDLANLTNVEVGESRRRAAQHDLIGVVAQDVYEQAMEGF